MACFRNTTSVSSASRYASCIKQEECSVSDHTACLVGTDRRSSVHRLPNMMGEKWQQWDSGLREPEWKWDAGFTEPRDLIKWLCNQEAFFPVLASSLNIMHATQQALCSLTYITRRPSSYWILLKLYFVVWHLVFWNVPVMTSWLPFCLRGIWVQCRCWKPSESSSAAGLVHVAYDR